MITTYMYEYWDGKKVVGHYRTPCALVGRFLMLPYQHELKQSYFKKVKYIKLRIIQRVVMSTPTDVHYRLVLDVSKKSKRQMEVLLNL